MDDDVQENQDDSVDFSSDSSLLVFSSRTTDRHVVYIHSEDYLTHSNRFCKIAGRVDFIRFLLLDNKGKELGKAGIVHSLIKSYGLLNYMRLLPPQTADENDLKLFHSSAYLECLERNSKQKDTDDSDSEREEYGLNYDCPAFDGVFESSRMVAGASIVAANCIVRDEASVAINWSGGWHHAKKDEASGFCYINDVVLCILKLLTKYSRVLYVDLDLHHGDGVEDAFCATAKVMTVSFHKNSPGFFPGSGSVKDCGLGRGKYYAVNVPLKDGVSDQTYTQVFNRVIDMVTAKFHAEAIVCQCGADGIAGDPEASYNLTPRSMIECISRLLQLDRPVVLLGGGGYNFVNTARCWTSVTASLLGVTLQNEIPDNDKYFTKYGPDYDLNVPAGNMRNANTSDYINKLLSTIQENLSHIS